MGYASSAVRTWSDARSASEYTATEAMPISRRVRVTRTAISPRLATRTLRKGRGMGGWDPGGKTGYVIPSMPAEPPNLAFDFSPRQPPPPPEEPRPLTVAELDRAIKGSLDESFARSVWVEGEVADA